MPGVMFCCNDERGNFTGKVDGISVDDHITLAGPPRVVSFRPGFTQVGRSWYPSRQHQHWVGNVCWDAVWMSVASAQALVRRLISAGWVVEEYAESGPFAALARGAG